MKALSVLQPWAQLLAIGAKVYETRNWPGCRYRGALAIHASAGWGPDQAYEAMRSMFSEVLAAAGFAPERYDHDKLKGLPLGAIVAIGRVVDVITPAQLHERVPLTRRHLEYAFGNWSAGRIGIELADVVMLPEPVPCKGALQLWDVPEETETEIRVRFGDMLGGLIEEVE